MRSRALLPAGLVVIGATLCILSADAQVRPSGGTTAWRGGQFHLDTAAVLSRSDIVLERANTDPSEAMPVGNGRVGAAVWSANGLTAQLNRADTMPERLAAGQVEIPGLKKLTQAADYEGRLDLMRGEFRERGGGMTALVYAEPNADALVVEVTGANPTEEQMVELRLWDPRAPIAGAEGPLGWFAEKWVDNKEEGASGQQFGSLAAITADARNPRATVTDKRTVTVRFLPDPAGHYRILVMAPHFDGSVDAQMAATRAMTAARGDVSLDAHAARWKAFWQKAGLIRITSGDGVGEYMENLRHIYLYVAACERGEAWPGSQAGVADMISAARDWHKWDSASFWHWNLRMQVAANLGAGLTDLNMPYFDLYLNNLGNIRYWTRTHMHQSEGSCIPETMRFNGVGIEYERNWNPSSTGRNCDADSKPYYNARTLSTGSEVGLWVWQQFLATEDMPFLQKYFPLMGASARFLLASQHAGKDGKLHTTPSNAHETQWDVIDPTTDLAAAKALYPAVDQATQILDIDRDLAFGLRNALERVPDFPRVPIDAPNKLVPASQDGLEQDMIGNSYMPEAPLHNNENLGLEPVWPYNLIGDRSDEFPLALRTYKHRPDRVAADWSYDPVQAARLDLGSEVEATLTALTEHYQNYPNGMAKLSPDDREFYVEQSGVTALALQEALVQDYDGILRIAPALPAGWDFSGTVWVRGKAKVDVQTRGGVPTTIVIEPSFNDPITLRNPWPGQTVEVVEGKSGKAVKVSVNLDLVTFKPEAKANYLVRRSGELGGIPYAAVSGVPSRYPKRLGPSTIGIFAK